MHLPSNLTVENIMGYYQDEETKQKEYIWSCIFPDPDYIGPDQMKSDYKKLNSI